MRHCRELSHIVKTKARAEWKDKLSSYDLVIFVEIPLLFGVFPFYSSKRYMPGPHLGRKCSP